jgi:hypothetical protein
MKTIATLLLPVSLLASSFAFGGMKAGEQLSNNDRPAINMLVVSTTKEGVPTAVGFSKQGKVIAFAKVTLNEDAINSEEGEVYNVTGPQAEENICNLNAKLSIVEKEIKIDYDPADVGAMFFQYCPELTELSGIYKK